MQIILRAPAHFSVELLILVCAIEIDNFNTRFNIKVLHEMNVHIK